MKPFDYLNHLFEVLPQIDMDNEDELDKLLPWSEKLPEDCTLEKSKD